MSSRPLAGPFPAILNGNMSGNITSKASLVPNLSMMSYAYSWTGTAPVGTVSIQVSNDYSINPNGSVNNPGTWTTIWFNLNGTPAMSAPVTGSPGNGFIDVDATGAYAIRTIYTFTSGTGTLQAVFNAKVS
jgi:hypothetical protein